MRLRSSSLSVQYRASRPPEYLFCSTLPPQCARRWGRWALGARGRSSWLCCAVGMPAAQRPMSRLRWRSSVLCREPVTWVSAGHISFPRLTRRSTPPLWVWSQWVGASVSCMQDRQGYSKVALPIHYFRPLVVLEAVARPGREAGTSSGRRGRGWREVGRKLMTACR